jgi:hypothetical protein
MPSSCHFFSLFSSDASRSFSALRRVGVVFREREAFRRAAREAEAARRTFEAAFDFFCNAIPRTLLVH